MEKKISSYNKQLVAISLFLLVILVIAAVSIGTVPISFNEVNRTVFSKLSFTKSLNDVSVTNEIIVFDIRFPRAILSLLIGMALAAVGGVYQIIFKNPMADPFVLGTSSGAALGASIAIVFAIETNFVGASTIVVFAFMGAILTTITVYNIARVGNRVLNINLLLAGIAVNFFLSSIISFIMILNRNQIEKIVFWTLGSLSAAKWMDILLLALVTIPSILIIYCFSRDLNIIMAGEETAKSIGVDVERVKKLMIILSSIIVAASVSVSGIIGFVGLIIPHVVKFIVGYDFKKVFILSILWGASFMIVCDILARTLLAPSELPIGVLTSFFGSPYFIYLLFKQKRKVQS